MKPSMAPRGLSRPSASGVGAAGPCAQARGTQSTTTSQQHERARRAFMVTTRKGPMRRRGGPGTARPGRDQDAVLVDRPAGDEDVRSTAAAAPPRAAGRQADADAAGLARRYEGGHQRE